MTRCPECGSDNVNSVGKTPIYCRDCGWWEAREHDPDRVVSRETMGRGDRVWVRLYGGHPGKGVVVAVDGTAGLYWVRVDKGPDWAVGQVTSVVREHLEKVGGPDP